MSTTVIEETLTQLKISEEEDDDDIELPKIGCVMQVDGCYANTTVDAAVEPEQSPKDEETKSPQAEEEAGDDKRPDFVLTPKVYGQLPVDRPDEVLINIVHEKHFQEKLPSGEVIGGHYFSCFYSDIQHMNRIGLQYWQHPSAKNEFIVFDARTIAKLDYHRIDVYFEEDGRRPAYIELRSHIPGSGHIRPLYCRKCNVSIIEPNEGIPCPNCRFVWFCSQKCFDRAFLTGTDEKTKRQRECSSCHKVAECEFYKALLKVPFPVRLPPKTPVQAVERATEPAPV